MVFRGDGGGGMEWMWMWMWMWGSFVYFVERRLWRDGWMDECEVRREDVGMMRRFCI